MPDRDVYWDMVNSLTHDHISDTVVEQIFLDNPMYATLEANNRVTMRGSDAITWPVMHDKLNAGSYRGMTPFPSQEKNILKRAVLPWKNLFVDVVVDGPQALRASGPLAVQDLMTYLRNAAVITGSDLMGIQLYGSGMANGGADLDGAEVGFDDGQLYDTYAGFSRAANDWWRGKVDATGGALTETAMNESYGNATVGNAHPNVITTSQTLWNKLWARVQPAQRYEASNEKNKMAQIGFAAIRFNGADVVHDSHAPAGTISYWNTDYVELVVRSGRMFQWTGWKQPANQDGYQGQLLFMGNFCFKSPRMLARDTGVT